MKHLIRLTKRVQLLDFLEVCLDCRTPHELEALLGDIFTEQELISVSERWTIAKLLHMGFAYRAITAKTGASAGTISRMGRMLINGSGGLRQACQRREDSFVDDEPEEPSYPLLCRAFQ
jgi:TrpR-related protein YerC/YecD